MGKPRRGSTSRIQDEDADDHATEMFKDYDLYLATKIGNLDDFKRILGRVSTAESSYSTLRRLSPTSNTFLHVAAKHGNGDVVAFIAAKDPPLLSSKNFTGETALHLAARTGGESAVKALVNSHQVLFQLDQNEGGERNFLRIKNERGNTALHEALFSCHYLIAEYLINKDSELLYCQNNVGEFALYLAAKAGFINCVSSILRLSKNEERINDQFRKKSPIQAAIRGKHRGVLEAMFNSKPSLIRFRDDEGRNPLHHAALFGDFEGVRYLLDLCPNNATRRDNTSSFPIHLASMEGHVDVVRLLHQAGCPDPGELLNNDSCSILHVAAENGRSNVVRLILKNPDLEHLINMKDKCGNTSLHVAANFFQAKVVSTLTWDKRVDIDAVNEDGMTALDVAVESTNQNSTPFAQESKSVYTRITNWVGNKFQQQMGRIDLLFELERELRSRMKKAVEMIDNSDEEDVVGEQRRGSTSGIQEDDSSEIRSQCDDDDENASEIFKDYELYLAAKNGNLDDFKRILDRVSTSKNAYSGDILYRLSPIRNTFLHEAARHGIGDVVTVIAEEKPSLLLCKNFAGETALHLAATAGGESVVKTLIKVHREFQPDQNEGDENNLLRAETVRGNTALHEALLNCRESIAEYLIKEDPEQSYCQNNVGEFPLYLAAKGGFVNCVSLILRLSTDEERLNDQFRKKSPIQAAIQGKHRHVLEAMFDTNPSFIRFRDNKGLNPLHHAALFGHLEGARYLLDHCPDNATRRDNKGSFPIHLASIEGHVDVVRLLLQHCYDPGELLNNNGGTILHIAAATGKSNIVSLVLNNPDLEQLINVKDKSGNTSLHVAAMFFQAKVVSTMTWDKRVDINAINQDGITALDFAVESPHSNSSPFSQILTWAALKAAGTPRYFSGKTAGKKMISDMGNHKDIVNTLLLVSTLVATVTYAAGFTVPGGYNSSESDGDVGMATMLRDRGFHMFVFCDSIAMYSSLVVAVALIWAQFGDLTLVLNALILAVPFLGIALSMMSVAFAAGLFLAVSKLRWLSIVVLVMGLVFLVIMVLLLLPLCTPLTSRNKILHYISYYPFCWLIIVSSKCIAV